MQRVVPLKAHPHNPWRIPLKANEPYTLSHRTRVGHDKSDSGKNLRRSLTGGKAIGQLVFSHTAPPPVIIPSIAAIEP